MSMSAKAYSGLKAVAEWNPSTARFLLFVLKETPHFITYKDDLYGPLTLLLINDVIKKPLFQNMSAPPPAFPHLDEIGTFVKLPPFPREKLADCKIFGNEWRGRKITKQEFADALEQILSELP
jgi:hypothetical protein